MPPPMEIPGYYYDKEKSKYFKIEGSGSASKSAYTTEVVKKRQALDLEEEMQVKKVKRGLTGIKRAFSFDSTLCGHGMSREHGTRPDSDIPRRILAEGLIQGGIYVSTEWPTLSIEPLFCIKSRWDRGEDVVEIHSAKNNGMASNFVRFVEDGHLDFLTGSTRYTFANSGQTSSLSMHEGSGLCASTWLSGSTETGIAIFNDSGSDDTENRVPSISLGPGTTRGPEVDVFSSTAAPSSSPFLFAFGTSRGILTLDSQSRDLTWAKGSLANKAAIEGDYLALSFLSLPSSPSNGQTLLCGERSGLVRFVDFRDPSNPTERTEFILHPTTITNIQQVSDHGILISGLRNQLQQYDMRFLKPTPIFPLNSKTRPTNPSLVYPHYKNSFHINIGLDVDLTSGIIAAAQESTYSLTPRVQLLSLTTGEPLYSPSINKEYILPPRPGHEELKDRKSHRLKDNSLLQAMARRKMMGKEQKGGVRYKVQANPPRCVKWNEDIEGQMKSLYVSDDRGTISRYAWGRRGEEDDFELSLVR